MVSSIRVNSAQECEINVPCDAVFKHLCDLDHWNDWNLAVRLSADAPLADGVWSKAIIVSPPKRKGDTTTRGTTVDFTVETIRRKDFTFSWTTRLGRSRNTTTMKLTPLGSKRTLLTHVQCVRGPFVRLGNPLRTLLTNSTCINQSLKNHVESLHFQAILMNVSTGDFAKPRTSSTSVESDGSDASPGFWQSPHYLREEVVSQLLEECRSDHREE
jgi:hypothetical protein